MSETVSEEPMGDGECSTCDDEGPLFRWYAKNGEVVLLCEDCHGKAFAWFWDHFREDDCDACTDTAPATDKTSATIGEGS